jgi:exonuclease SbcC
MPVTVRVQGFQSIADAEIEVSGLTVVTGANNSGKSALIRAVSGAFTNPRGTKYVRRGEDQCTVDLVFGDGHTLKWEKGEKINRYTVDGGKPMDKVGQTVPREVEALGVVPITAAGHEIWPQFAPQFTGQVFLLDKPGSMLAESIADVTRVGVLNEALRQSQSDRRTAASELKIRQTDVLHLEGIEAGYVGLDLVEALATEAEKLDAFVASLRGQVGELCTLQGTHDALVATVEEFLPVRSVTVPGGVDAIRGGLAEFDELTGMASEVSSAMQVITDLSPVAGLVLPDTARPTKMSDALALLQGLRDQMQPLMDVVKDGDGIRGVLAVPLPDLVVAQGVVETLESHVQLRDDLTTRSKMVDNLTLELSRVEEAYDGAIHEVQELIGEAGICPICGNG